MKNPFTDLNRAQRRSYLRPWRLNPRRRVRRAISRAKMPRGYRKKRIAADVETQMRRVFLGDRGGDG